MNRVCRNENKRLVVSCQILNNYEALYMVDCIMTETSLSPCSYSTYSLLSTKTPNKTFFNKAPTNDTFLLIFVDHCPCLIIAPFILLYKHHVNPFRAPLGTRDLCLSPIFSLLNSLSIQTQSDRHTLWWN
jgi:hypothetical protein